MSSKKRSYNSKGGSLVELIIVSAIITGALSVIVGLATVFLVNSSIVSQTAEATALAQEALETIRNYRDGTAWYGDNPGIEYDGLGVLDFDLAPFRLEKSTDTPPRWKMVSGTETIGAFTRELFFEQLQRDASDNISASGALDPDSVEALVRITWQERGRSHEVRIVTYLTNWQQL